MLSRPKKRLLPALTFGENMFDKFEARRKLNHLSAYAWLTYGNNHHVRYRRFIESMPRPLICQSCSGAGGEHERLTGFYEAGPWFPCGWCEGTGFVTPWMRGQWLRMQREGKRAA